MLDNKQQIYKFSYDFTPKPVEQWGSIILMVGMCLLALIGAGTVYGWMF